MANVQIDDGEFTRIANVLLEKVAAAKLNGCQSSIVLIVFRYTYGFQRKEHDLSPSFISDATGYDKRQIQRELVKLVSRNIITQKSKNGITRKLSFNKNYDTWDALTYGKLADGESADGELTVGTYGKLTDGTYGKLADQERNKENSKETYKEVEEEPQSAMDAYRYSFKKFNYTGHIQGYILKLKERGVTDAFIKEVFLEMGARGIGPDIAYMEKLAEDWITKGVLTRAEAKRRRDLILLKGGQQNAKHGTGHDGRSAAELNALSL